MSGIKIKRRNLPYWELDNSVYFVTFKTINITLSYDEQLIVKKHIIEGNESFYDLYAVIIMPDHVHLILKPLKDFSLSKIMKGIKGVSANKLNKQNFTQGSIWQDESFDRILRDEKGFNEKLQYMYNNPIKAGLTEKTWDYHGWFLNEKLLQR